MSAKTIANLPLQVLSFLVCPLEELKAQKNIPLEHFFRRVYFDVFSNETLNREFYSSFKNIAVKITGEYDKDNEAIIKLLEEAIKLRKAFFRSKDWLDSFLESLGERKKKLEDSLVYFSPYFISNWIETKSLEEINDIIGKTQDTNDLIASKAAVKKMEMLNQQYEQLPVNGVDSLAYLLTLANKAIINSENLVYKIMRHERFNEIDANGKYSLGNAVVAAAYEGQVGALKVLMGHERFGEIDANGQYSLGHALVAAARNGHVEALEVLMEHKRFKEINANGRNSLDHAVFVAAQKGQVEALKVLMGNDERFGEINANGPNSLGHAVFVAAQKGQVEALEVLMEHKRFGEIDANGPDSLGHAVFIAAQKGQAEALEVLMGNDERFGEINANGGEYSLSCAVWEAAQNGQAEALEVLMGHARFGEINTTGEYSLSKALNAAILNNRIEVVKMFIKQPSIKPTVFISALFASFGNWQIFKMIFTGLLSNVFNSIKI